MKNRNQTGIFIFAVLLLLMQTAGIHAETPYTVVSKAWSEWLGNHRAVLKIDRAADAMSATVTWRRHDRNPEKHRFIIISSAGDTIANIHRLEVTNEQCRLVFGPVKAPGTYYFYYLPYQVQKENGFYSKGYYQPEGAPDAVWLGNVNAKSSGTIPMARVEGFEARTSFDSFYPMEVVALKSEKESFISTHPGDFLIFPEDRSLPVRMLDAIPLRWVERGPSESFSGKAMQNEYYCYQLGIYASAKALQNVQVRFSALKNGDHVINTDKLTCFNTGGINPYGELFMKRVDVAQDHVQPLWMGVDIDANQAPGIYTGEVTISADNAATQKVRVSLEVENKVIADRGDNETWRHSRLRWLNSTLGLDDENTQPYKPLKHTDTRTFMLTGKKVVLGTNGLPSSIDVKGTEVLRRPVELVVKTREGKEQFSQAGSFHILKDAPGIFSGTWKSASPNFELTGEGSLESDGYLHYTVKLKAKRNLTLADVSLDIPFRERIAREMMGMGLPGTDVPASHAAKWNGPHDSFWMGNTHAGIWCELRGSTYSGPLLNLYHPAYPPSWYNDNKGGFSVSRTKDEVLTRVYSGERSLKAGESISFEWSLLLTPVKDINYKSQFTDRYYHNGDHPMPSEVDLQSGVKIVNLHHANAYNPNINYPFVAVDSMKWFVNTLHAKGLKVKIYYTVRELTEYVTELWALRSLGNEILGGGNGGGYPWLREHLVTNYTPQWYQWFPDKSADASILSAAGDSRWYNYYIEGLRWLVKHVDIDGLYLDDVAYDRRILKRMRKVLDREKPGCLLDLHSNTGFSRGPATQYTEFFPYLNKLWFGESFMYDKMPPANWLVEVSGVPFGLMGDMLHRGGNPWRGMVYGMTVRYPWYTEGFTCDPRNIWKVWDSFGIADAKMRGYWEDNCPVRTSNPKVLATAYVKNGKTLLSIASWDTEVTNVQLKIDWKALGLNPRKVTLTAPAIPKFQEATSWKPNDPIRVEPTKGWLILLSEK